MPNLSKAQRDALIEVATAIGCDPLHLEALIEFESGWNPLIKNRGSSARGLIQFMDATAKDLGYTGSLDLVTKHPTIEAQLRGPVLEYLSLMAPLDTFQSLCMAVFYPAARRWPVDRPFPAKVQAANPGIETVRDYLEHVWRRAGQSGPMPVDAPPRPTVAPPKPVKESWGRRISALVGQPTIDPQPKAPAKAWGPTFEAAFRAEVQKGVPGVRLTATVCKPGESIEVIEAPPGHAPRSLGRCGASAFIRMAPGEHYLRAVQGKESSGLWRIVVPDPRAA